MMAVQPEFRTHRMCHNASFLSFLLFYYFDLIHRIYCVVKHLVSLFSLVSPTCNPYKLFSCLRDRSSYLTVVWCWQLDCMVSTWLHTQDNGNAASERSSLGCVWAELAGCVYLFLWPQLKSDKLFLVIIPSTGGELVAIPVSTRLQCWLNMFCPKKDR